MASQPQPGATATPVSRESLKFIFPNNKVTITFFGYYVARDAGFFEEEKLDVTFLGSDGSGAAVQQIIAGQVDAGTPISVASLNAAAKGQPTRFIYSYSTGANFGLFVKQDSPIRSVADLKGKTIGISDPAGGEVPIVDAALKGVGLNPQADVRKVAIGEGGPASYQAIDTGQVAAYSSSYTDYTTLLAAGLTLRDITPSEFRAFPAHGITTTNAVLASKREVLGRFGRALAKATLFCHTNREACKAILKKAGPEQWTNEKLGEGLLDRMMVMTKVAEGAKFGTHDRAGFKTFQEFQAAADPNFKPVALDSFLSDDLVEAFNAFDRAQVIAKAKAYKP